MAHEKKITNFKKHQVLEYEKESLLFLEEILKDIPRNAKKMEARKNHFAQEHGIPTLKNRELIVAAQRNKIVLPENVQRLIQKRAVRTVSGVSPIGILTKPFDCPGKCTYCPTEDRMPKSYMKNQPAAARALRNNFDPFNQVKNRIIALEESGHPASKLEIIVMGGTWSFLPRGYQHWYVSEVFRAANSFDVHEIKNHVGASIYRAQNMQEGCDKSTPLLQKPKCDIDIREVELADWIDILALEKQTLAPLGLDDILQECDYDKYLLYIEKYWVVEHEGRIIGMGGYRKVNDDVVEIKRVRIHPEYQNKKIGQELVSVILKDIESLKFQEIILDFLESLSSVNTPFYSKFGFTEYKRELEERGERLFYKKKVGAQCIVPLPKNKPILFLDFDGVIADSYDFVFTETRNSLAENDVVLTEKDFQEIFRAENIWQAFIDFGSSEEISEKYSAREQKHYSNSVMPFEGIIPMLQTFSQYFDLHIISANQKPVIEEFVQKHHITSLFCNILGRDSGGSKSEKMMKICEEKNISPSSTFFVGDTISDMKEGKKAGVQTLAAGWGNIFTAQELAEINPTAVLSSLDDLQSFFGIEESHIQAGENEGDIVERDDYSEDSYAHSLVQNHFNLEALQKENETASHRVIGLTLETRPDFINEKELIRMRKYGCTRIEIGVQTLHDEIQKLTKRGHTKAQVARAMRQMKDFGFKVCFHLMPGLPGSNPEKDLEMMKEVFENSDFKPDFIKIYPCMVLPTSELAGIWKRGDFTPIDDKELVKLLIKFQTYVPEWTRIMRFMRDIPATNILDGAKFSNLRQILQEQPKKLLEIVGQEFYDTHDLGNNSKKLFRDIRSREVGFSDHKAEAPVLKRRDYDASQGKEVFLSFESEDESQLFALLRLRKSSNLEIKDEDFRNVLENAALIREVHSYGTELSVGENETENKNDDVNGSQESGQHKGLGKKLIAESEHIAKEEWGMQKMVIIAGIGTREYYRKWGYEEACGYMVKEL